MTSSIETSRRRCPRPAASAASFGLFVALLGCGGDDDKGGNGGGDTSVAVDASGDGGPIDDGGGSDAGDAGPIDAAIDAALIEPPIDERCPDAQTGDYVLVLYPDRVDAYRRRDFNALYFCRFLALAENGIRNATGMARGLDGDYLVVQPEDGEGSVYRFSANGEFKNRSARNINLAGVRGIWRANDDEFVVWSTVTENFYRLSNTGAFRGQWTPPAATTPLIRDVNQVTFLSEEAVVVSYRDRRPQLFMAPDAPFFPEDLLGPSNAVIGIESNEGLKPAVAGRIGGPNGDYGVLLFKPINVGRERAIERERTIVAAGGILDGTALLALESGIFVLDATFEDRGRLLSFNSRGEVQQEIPLNEVGTPLTAVWGFGIFPDL